jgi:hypothetical protein
MQSHPHLYSRTPRPTIPQFLDSPTVGQVVQAEQDEPFGAYLQEYRALGDDFHSAMSFAEFCNIKSRNRPKGFNRAFNQNFELQRTLGKLTIPNFDGSSSCTARAWVQKLDTYFQLNPMMETDAIKLATLHLDGEAHDWWYHGLVTLGHNNITSYLDFTQRLIECFDKKDPEIHFRELAQLKQTGSPEDFISEFQRVVVMVTDISESRLVMLFTEALAEPLRGWVKAYKPTTLQDAISRTRDLQDAVPKSRFPPKPTFPIKDKDKKPFQKDWPRKDRMDEDTRRELRRKKLCFSCQEPWAPGHRCSGKGKAHYIEVYSDSGEDEDDQEQVHEEELRATGDEQFQDDVKGGVIATLSGVPRFHTFRVRGVVQGHRVGVLIDGGATHNFIDVAWVTRRGIPTKSLRGLQWQLQEIIAWSVLDGFPN